MVKKITNLNRAQIKFSSVPFGFIGLSCFCRHCDVTHEDKFVHNDVRTTDKG
jgi:hypothetical protein